MCADQIFVFAAGMISGVACVVIATIAAHLTEDDSEKSREKPDFHSDTDYR